MSEPGPKWGNVRQLDAVTRETLVSLLRHAPLFRARILMRFWTWTHQPGLWVRKARGGLRLYPDARIAPPAGGTLRWS
jgi:hypothetical protein